MVSQRSLGFSIFSPSLIGLFLVVADNLTNDFRLNMNDISCERITGKWWIDSWIATYGTSSNVPVRSATKMTWNLTAEEESHIFFKWKFKPGRLWFTAPKRRRTKLWLFHFDLNLWNWCWSDASSPSATRSTSSFVTGDVSSFPFRIQYIYYWTTHTIYLDLWPQIAPKTFWRQLRLFCNH